MHKFVFLILFFLPVFLFSQQRCGTVEYEKMRNPQLKKKETTEQFEQWMQQMLVNKPRPDRPGGRTQTTLVVPVVVHVIYTAGDANPGTRTNISDAQIQSQIDVLNKDYQRLNADASQTPSEFLTVAGSWDIQFVLAKQDPDGAATSGVVRVQGTQDTWTITDDRTLKALSYWPAEDYLNLWVTDLSGIYIGYTQLPVSSTLLGLEQSSNDRLTDGVVIDYQAFGTIDAGSFDLTPQFNKGRTATHEIGHYFGLRHIWGDVGNCQGTDYVDDTPTQNNSTSGCPTGILSSCGDHNMYQNYLDYTDDACMNIFTQGQVSRMTVVAQNSPRRASLASSLGAIVPAPVPNDLGIKSILNPLNTACSGGVSPSITVRNYGSNTITSAQLQFLLNGALTETKNISVNLNPGDESVVNFSAATVSEGLSYTFDFTVISVNGASDGQSANNDLSVVTTIPVGTSLPMVQAFNSTPTDWTIENPSGTYPWQNFSVSNTNNAMYLNFYDNPNLDSYSRLVSPVIDLTNETTATLTFDHAYSVFSSANPDRLRVIIYTTCAYDNAAVEVFNKTGTALATTNPSYNQFIPEASQWKTNFISLLPFLGKKIQIAFEGINENGNNLFIDNVTVLNTSIVAFELADLASPSPVSCNPDITPVIAIKNVGNTIITSMESHLVLNNGAESIQNISGISINPGSTQNISLNNLSLITGNNNLSIWIKNPNGMPNAATADSIAVIRNINTSAGKMPLRENFDPFSGDWQMVNPTSGENWAFAKTNKRNDSISVYYDAFNRTDIGDQAWLVSPTLDFSSVGTRGETGFSLFFETSYRKRSSGNDLLEVYASQDCGVTFPTRVFSKSANELDPNLSATTTSWTPTKSSDWIRQQSSSLDGFAGKTNIRFAFVFTNDNGNNLYLDDIEFYLSDNPFPVKVDSPYNVYGGLNSPVKITFNLDQLQNVNVQMYSMQGNLLTSEYLTDVLNQTYTINVPDCAAGVYIIRVQTANSISSTKVFLGF